MRLTPLFSLFLLLMLNSAAFANFVISFEDTQMNSGESGFIDVYITGQAGDTLGRFGYEFNISGASPQSGDLQFRAIQSGSAQNETSPPPYIFLGDTDPGNFFSGRANGGSNPISLVGSDVLASLNDVSIDGKFLLARLELTHVGMLTGASHDFTISLNPTSPFTVFDRDWDPGTDNNFESGQISTFSGTVTVTSQVVPEPSSIALFLFSAVGLVSRNKIRRFCRLPVLK